MIDLYTLIVFLHVVGSVIGVGTVTINDLQFTRAIGDRDLGIAYLKSAKIYSLIIVGALLLLIASGFYFMYAKPVLWGSEKILTKMALVGILTINGTFMNLKLRPKLLKLTGDDWAKKSKKLKNVASFGAPFGTIATVSWYYVLFLGAVGRQPWHIGQIVFVYVVLLAVGFVFTNLILRKQFSKK